jgi:hypothetical protein
MLPGMEQATTPWQRFADPERKRKFAALARVRPDTRDGRYEAACLTFPDICDNNLVFKAIEEYPFDRVVIEERARLEAAEPEHGLPTKAQQARDIYNLAQGAASIDEKLKAHKLYAEIMGHVVKPGEGNGGGNTYIDNRSVILLPRRETNLDEWEAQTITQQAQLVSNASK